MPGQLIDGNATIAEDAVLTINESDAALGDPGVGEAGVERDQTGPGAERRDVHAQLSLGALDHRQFDRLIAKRQSRGALHGAVAPGTEQDFGDRESLIIPAGPTTGTKDLPRSSRKLNFRPDERTVREPGEVQTKTTGNLRSMRDRSRRDGKLGKIQFSGGALQ